MSGQANGIYEFGRFRLEVTERRLLRDGHPVPLRGKVFDTLRVLVERRGHLLGKDALMKAVWPDSIVEENNLAHNITTLRKALGEKATGQKFVETIPRQGYRFVAEVKEIGNTGVSLAAGPLLEPPSSCCLVQRESELLSLRTCLQKALGGARQIVFVTGDAGLGKTTLVNAFVEEAGTRNALWVGRGQCLEHRGTGEAYLPVLDAFGRMCREPGGQNLIDLLSQHAPAWLAQMPWLVSDTEFEKLQRKVVGTTQQRMLREMVEAMEALTVEQPLVLVLEDLHWSDYSTVDLLSWLGRRHEPARLLVIGTYRPADVKKSGHPIYAVAEELKLRWRCEELPMTFLTEAAVGEYLISRFPGVDFPAGLTPLLHQRTDGNPLFIVTLVDQWIAQGSLVEADGEWELNARLEDLAVGVPDSLRQLIERQLGQLSPLDQQILEAASISGSEFSAAVVAAATGESEDAVESRLAALARQGQFVRSRGRADFSDGTVTSLYGFVHDLHQEVLYDRVPAGLGARLHRQIGARLETAYGERAPEMAAELADHFTRGRDARNAVRYLQLAAEQALRRNAHREAIGHLARGLELLQSLPEDRERAQWEFTFRTTLGTALVATKGWAAPELEGALVRARELCEQLGEPSQLSSVLFGLAAMHEFRGHYRQSEALLEQRLRLSSPPSDDTPRLESHVLLACSLFHQGVFTRAIEHAEEGLTLYNPQHHLAMFASFGENAGVACHNWAALSLWFLGYPDQALERAHKAVGLALEPFHLYSLAGAQTHVALVHQLRLEESHTKTWAEATIQLATERGFPYSNAAGTVFKGWALAVQGQHEEGIALLRQGLAECRAAGVELDRPYYLALLADAYRRRGPPEAGLFALAEAVDTVRDSRTFFYEAELYRLQGILLIEAGVRDCYEVEAFFRQALDTAQRQNAKSLELRAAMSLARLWREQGMRAEAHQLVADVYGWFTEGFDTPDLRRARAFLER